MSDRQTGRDMSRQPSEDQEQTREQNDRVRHDEPVPQRQRIQSRTLKILVRKRRQNDGRNDSETDDAIAPFEGMPRQEKSG